MHFAWRQTHWPLGDVIIILSMIFKLILQVYILSTSHETACKWMSQDLINDTSILIVSGNDLVPSGNKPLPETMLTQIYVVIWGH